MSALSDFGFDAVFQKSVKELKQQLTRDALSLPKVTPEPHRGRAAPTVLLSAFDAVREFRSRFNREAPSLPKLKLAPRRGSVAAMAVFCGLGVLSIAIFVIGYSALLSNTPEIWIHRLMALAIAQSILIGAVTMKLLPAIERRKSIIQLGTMAAAKLAGPSRNKVALRIDPVPPPLPQPPKPIVGGKLAGREYLQYDDGSIEIDTLVGRRRFVSIGAAREFVGS